MDKSDEHGFMPSSFGREKRFDVGISRLEPRGKLADIFIPGVAFHEEEDAENAAIPDRATIADKERQMLRKTKGVVDRCHCCGTSGLLGHRSVCAAPNESILKNGSARRRHKQKTSSFVASLPGILRDFIEILRIIAAPMTRSLCFVLTCLLRLAAFFTLTPFGATEISGYASTEWKASPLSKLPSNPRTKSETELLKVGRKFEDVDAANFQLHRQSSARESHNSKKKFNPSLAMVDESRREDRMDNHSGKKLSPQFQAPHTKPNEDSIGGNKCLKRLSSSKGYKHMESSQVAAAKNASVFTMQNCKSSNIDQSFSLDRQMSITSRCKNNIFTDQVGIPARSCKLSSFKCQLLEAVENFAAKAEKTKQPVVQVERQASKFLVEEGTNGEHSVLSAGEVPFPELAVSRTEQAEDMLAASARSVPLGQLMSEQKVDASCSASVDSSKGNSVSDSLALLSKFAKRNEIDARPCEGVDEGSAEEKDSTVVKRRNSADCEATEFSQVRIQPPAEGSFERSETRTPKSSHYSQPIDAKSKWLEMKRKFYGNDYGKMPVEPNQPKLEPSLSTAKLPANQMFQYNIAVARARQIGTDIPACEDRSKIFIEELAKNSSYHQQLANSPSRFDHQNGTPLLQTRSLSQWPLEVLDPRRSRKYYPSTKLRTDRKVFKNIGNSNEDGGYANCSASSSQLNSLSRPTSVDRTATPRQRQGVNRNEEILLQFSDDEEKNGDGDDVFMLQRDSRDIERRDKPNSAVDQFLKNVDGMPNNLRSNDENSLYESCSERSDANLSRSRNKNLYREVDNFEETTDGSLPWYSELFIEDDQGTEDN